MFPILIPSGSHICLRELMSHWSFLLLFKFYIDSLFLCYLKVGMAARAVQKKKQQQKLDWVLRQIFLVHMKPLNNDCEENKNMPKSVNLWNLFEMKSLKENLGRLNWLSVKQKHQTFLIVVPAFDICSWLLVDSARNTADKTRSGFRFALALINERFCSLYLYSVL